MKHFLEEEVPSGQANKSINLAKASYVITATSKVENVSAEDCRWSGEEIQVAVSSYIEMLNCELKGLSYTKAKFNNDLRNSLLKNRSKGSIEFRMQNISAVLDSMGLPYISGYKPRKNVGKDNTELIKKKLLNHNEIVEFLSETTNSLETYEKRARVLKEIEFSDPPQGIENPPISTQEHSVYKRDPKVRAWVLFIANGICEMCDLYAPFSNDEGEPFLEIHHIIRLADGGRDTVDNTVALCPNCHRELHYSSKRSEKILRLTQKVVRLKKW